MEKLIALVRCEDGSCCCLTQRTTVALISIICLIYSYFDNLITCRQESDVCYVLQEQVDCARKLLVTLFQMANIILLLGVYFEKATLLKIYLMYVLGFIVMNLIMSIVDFVLRLTMEGPRCLLSFISEVAFFFVLFRCLPLVDAYRRHLEKIY